MDSQATSITAHVIGGAEGMVCELKKNPTEIIRKRKKLIAAKNTLKQEFFFWKARVLFGVDTPEGPHTPKTPLPVPPPDRKGNHSAPF